MTATQQVNCEYPGCNGEHTPDLPLARKIYDHITHNPSEWNQGVWGRVFTNIKLKLSENFVPQVESKATACNSAFCVAGWAVQMAGPGYQLPTQKAQQTMIDASNEFAQHRSYDMDIVEVDGVQLSTQNAAIHLLGITAREADFLFGGGNTLPEIKRYFENIAARCGETF